MPDLRLSTEEYNRLLEKVYQILSRTEQLDQVTHHLMWDVWRLLYYSQADTSGDS
ncbi:hypothetical protein [Brevibacillus marinus]|uniref:hypothetical protein n=1 Tax=Brevibacillus marinus TaxID=2496837 RepID=UPI0013E0A8EB|nr:hypothetical protein [Brevibacillus marinus]